MEDQGRGKGGYVPAEYSHGYSEDIDVIRGREYPLLKGMHTRLYPYLFVPWCIPSLPWTLQILPIWTTRVRRCTQSR